MQVCYRAGGNGLAAPVLAGPVFLQAKIKFRFYKKRVINKSFSVILLGLLYLATIDRKSTSRDVRLLAARTFNVLLCVNDILLCKSQEINRVAV